MGHVIWPLLWLAIAEFVTQVLAIPKVTKGTIILQYNIGMLFFLLRLLHKC